MVNTDQKERRQPQTKRKPVFFVGRSRLRPVLAIIVLSSIATIGCRDKGGSTSGGNGPKDTPDVTAPTTSDFAKAIRLRNRGLGHLENQEWADAESTLSELVATSPDTLLPRRNLAISRVLMVTSAGFKRSGGAEEEKKYNDAATAAADAIEEFRSAIGKDSEKEGAAFNLALADLLMGQLLVHRDSLSADGIDEGVQYLRKAADAFPESASFQFAYASAMDGHRDFTDAESPKSADLLRALQKSFELAPQNLFALEKLMQRQALCLRAGPDSTDPQTYQLARQLPKTLEAAKELLAPFNESFQKQFNRDLVTEIGKALAAFDEADPRTLMGPAMHTGNLLKWEIAYKIDQRRLDRNLLEYVLINFDAEFQKAAAAAGAFKAPGPSVLKDFVAEDRMPSITNVTALKIVDMNLDSRDDLIVVREGRIEVYSDTAESPGQWSVSIQSPEIATGFTNFILADIDRDDDRDIGELKYPVLLRDADGDRKIVSDSVRKNRWYDTDFDVIAWGEDGVVVFRNDLSEDGTRSLVPLAQQETVTDINDVLATDLESDGDLDLVFATAGGMVLWKNLNGTDFQNMNASAALPQVEIRSLLALDVNRDVAMDVVGLTSDGDVGYLENVLHGRFRWVDELRPDNDGDAAGSFGGVLKQLNGFDVVQIGNGDANSSGQSGHSWQPRRLVGSVEGLSGNDLPLSAEHAALGDFDNDGHTDVIYVQGGKLKALHSPGSAAQQHLRSTSSESYESADVPNAMSHANAFADLQFGGASDVGELHATDLDDDGDLDLIYVARETGALKFLSNDGGNKNNWLDVVVRGKPDDSQFKSNRVNMHAIGSIVELRAGSLYHAEVVTGPKLHLGLGSADAADTIRVIWTDGVPQNVTTTKHLNAKVGILAPQILSGSCPYIYTWTGERFEFFSDCLWAAPLGLVQANGELAPTREWENLFIPGEALVEKDGHYVLQLTEELHETAYFDQVELTAIDHPADVKIFTNEKVGSPEMAQHKVHTVRNPRLPKSVTDGRGIDLLPGLTAIDGDYVQAFRGRVMQGLTDDWTMEFDLGDLSDAAGPGDKSFSNIRLFLTGWVFPTDTSLNVGIHQNPDLAPPAPLSIEVPDGTGGWKVARPFIGFPSGKTKAMVVDVTDIFDNEEDLRFRLRSSMELYWDQAFFTVNENEAPATDHSCPLVDGDLHYRGFSRRTYADNALFRNGHAPEGYNYDAVTTEPRWPPISGRFTKYGDTSVLLFDHDDRMVVMGPGDELTVRFAVPDTPIPDGWIRDFVLTNVGYDKDANLNTIYGQSSEPFPFRAMKQYPFLPDSDLPSSIGHRQYVDQWQTREYTPHEFWNALKQNAPAQ